MEYTTLGSTGMRASRLCLGCMSFGDPDWHDWVLEEDKGKEVIDRAIVLGINFFDTANMYSRGESERILGKALEGYDSDWPVVATKAYMEMNEDNSNASGLSRKAIEQELANSLGRLGMETVDLYQIHRWDYDTPIEETMRALDDAVCRGQVRYLGAPRCGPTSSPRLSIRAIDWDSTGSLPCRTTTISSTGRRNARCCRSVKRKGSA